MHCRGPSSVPLLCKQWELFTMVHHQGAPGAPPQHPRRAPTTFAQVFLAHDVENYSTYERGDDPAWAKSTFFSLLERRRIKCKNLNSSLQKKTTNLWRRKQNGSKILKSHTLLGHRAQTIDILHLPLQHWHVKKQTKLNNGELFLPVIPFGAAAQPHKTPEDPLPGSPEERPDTTHPCLLSTLTSGGSKERKRERKRQGPKM